jgi:hypothetical protein
VTDKIKKIYATLIAGATAGLSDAALYKHVKEECPKATSKKIVKASLLALSDTDVKDGTILQVIYALAIKHRLDPVSKDDTEETAVEEAPAEETVVELRPKKQKASKKKHEESPAAM